MRLRLFQAFTDPAPVLDDVARRVIEARTEPSEGFQFLELRIAELQIARDRPIGCALRGTTDSGHGWPTSTAGKTPSSNKVGER